MPAKQLRCEASVIPEGDNAGENAIELVAVLDDLLTIGGSLFVVSRF